jgi:hypothetical protein
VKHHTKVKQTKRKKREKKNTFCAQNARGSDLPGSSSDQRVQIFTSCRCRLASMGNREMGGKGAKGRGPHPPLSSLPLEPIPFFSAHITARALPERARTRRTAVSASPFWIGNCPLARPLPALLSPRTTRARKYKKLCCVVFVLRCVALCVTLILLCRHSFMDGDVRGHCARQT